MKRNEKDPSARVGTLVLAYSLAFIWWLLAITFGSRDYYLVNYGASRSIDAMLEPFGASWIAIGFAMLTAAGWVGMVRHAIHKSKVYSSYSIPRALVYFGLSLAPGIEWISHWNGESYGVEGLWVAYWFSGWTGLSFAELSKAYCRPIEQMDEKTDPKQGWYGFGTVCFFSLACGSWWTAQSYNYFHRFMLGFNDFGHFMQRVSNTANGQSMLLETPVLPAFWDHFNPGLLLLVPVWRVYPDVTLAFYLQSISLAGSAIAIRKISRVTGHSEFAATLFGIAWLFQPVVGQMNLAYTYGWHPISLAIPLLLLSLIAILQRRLTWAILSLFIALSMEEGVFVIAALFCAVHGVLRLELWLKPNKYVAQVSRALSWQAWFTTSVVLIIGFVLVFRFSGMAEFQTSRFAALGNSTWEVIMSPFFRPNVFWSTLFRTQNLYLLLGISLPCFVPSLIRAWQLLLVLALPLVVLFVWDHKPAQSLAFQYSSTLLPVLWLTAVLGSRKHDPNENDKHPSWIGSIGWTGNSAAMGALTTAWTLSLFLGQFPYSSNTLQDVQVRTYAPTESGIRLEIGSDENLWVHAQVAKIRQDKRGVLATGRIASHCVGNDDVETASQYLQRRDSLAKLVDRLDQPMLHYQWVVLDRQENFQQTVQEIDAIEREVNELGFNKVEDRYGIVVYQKP